MASIDSTVVAAAGKWRIIALTNNFAKSDLVSFGEGQKLSTKYAMLDLKEELKWLGWEDGAVSTELRAMFDDFCDSSELGMRSVCP